MLLGKISEETLFRQRVPKNERYKPYAHIIQQKHVNIDSSDKLSGLTTYVEVWAAAAMMSSPCRSQCHRYFSLTQNDFASLHGFRLHV